LFLEFEFKITWGFEVGPKRKLFHSKLSTNMPSLEIFGLQESDVLYFQIWINRKGMGKYLDFGKV
jgi:hypothetical protein